MSESKFNITSNNTISILGGGNIGFAVANGLVKSGKYKSNQIIIPRKQTRQLDLITYMKLMKK